MKSQWHDARWLGTLLLIEAPRLSAQTAKYNFKRRAILSNSGPASSEHEPSRFPGPLTQKSFCAGCCTCPNNYWSGRPLWVL